MKRKERKMKASEMTADRDRIRRLRLTLLRIACVTQCRRAYDLATEALGIRSADEVKRRAKKEGICR